MPCWVAVFCALPGKGLPTPDAPRRAGTDAVAGSFVAEGGSIREVTRERLNEMIHARVTEAHERQSLPGTV